MRNIVFAAFALGWLLAGCTTVPPPPLGSAPPPVSNTISNVQSITRTVCAFVPTAATIAGILARGNSAVSTASDIASAICTALAFNPMSEGPGGGRTVPKVLGVPIRGAFVK